MNENTAEEKLIEALCKGSSDAFDMLFHKYSPKLYRFSYSLLKNDEDAKEIVQEVFLRIWNVRGTIDKNKSFKSFLFTMSYNLTISQLRKKLKEKEYQEFLYEYFGNRSATQFNFFDYDTLKKTIKNTIDELPAKRKEIFILSREEGLSHKQIAEKLGISVKTVENQINLSLKFLKARCGSDFLCLLLFVSLSFC